jgi:hypothetical protein
MAEVPMEPITSIQIIRQPTADRLQWRVCLPKQHDLADMYHFDFAAVDNAGTIFKLLRNKYDYEMSSRLSRFTRCYILLRKIVIQTSAFEIVSILQEIQLKIPYPLISIAYSQLIMG